VQERNTIRPEQLDQLVSTVDAAQHARVQPHNIRDWKRRGILKPSGLDKYNRPLYKLIHVLEAEQSVRYTKRGTARK